MTWDAETRARLETLFARPFGSRDFDKVRVSDVFAALSHIDRLEARIGELEKWEPSVSSASNSALSPSPEDKP